jgi:cohesin loading factor subunit SCC2
MFIQKFLLCGALVDGSQEIRLYTSGLESAKKAAKTIVLFLTQRSVPRGCMSLVVSHSLSRSGKGKVTKNSNEAEYRTIFDNLISDLLVVLFWPEWPAASLLLSIICKFMVCDFHSFHVRIPLNRIVPSQVSSLDDVKTSNQAENNAAKTIALDHLGVIAARIRSSTLKFKPHGDNAQPVVLKSLDDVWCSI